MNNTESETSYSTFNLIPSVVFVLNSDAEISFINQYATDSLNIHLSDVKGKKFEELFYPTDENDILLDIPKLPDREEQVAIWSVGETKFLVKFKKVTHNSQFFLQAHSLDKFSEIEAEVEQLQNNASVTSLSRKAFEVLDQIFYVNDIKIEEGERREHKVVYISNQVEEILGTSPVAYKQNPQLWYELLHPDYKKLRDEIPKRLALKKEPITVEYQIKNIKTNKYIWIEDTIVPMLDKDSNIIKIFGSARDISKRKKSEQDLWKSRKRYVNFVKNSTEGIWRIGFEHPIDTSKSVETLVNQILYNGRLKECNNRMAEIYGVDYPKILHGIRVIDLFNIKEKGEMQNLRKKVADFVRNAWTAKNIITKIRDSRGDIKYVSTSTNCEIEESGLVKGFWGVQQDVTEEIITKKKLNKSFSELKLTDQINKASLDGASIVHLARVIGNAYHQFSKDITAFRFLSFKNECELDVVYEDFRADFKKNRLNNKSNFDKLLPSLSEDPEFFEFLKEGKIIISRLSKDDNINKRTYPTDLSQIKSAQSSLNIETLVLIPLVAKKELFGVMQLASNTELSEESNNTVKRFTNGIMTAISKTYSEKKIEEQKKFNQALLDNLPIDIAVFDENQRYRFVNRNAVSDEKTRKWLMGKTDLDYCKYREISKSWALRRETEFNKVLETKKSTSWVDTYITKDKPKKYILRNFKPIYHNGKLMQMVGYGIDISRQKNLEEILRLLTGVQEKFIKKTSDSNIFEELLNLYLDLTLSDSGFVALRDDSSGKFVSKTITDKYWLDNLSTITGLFKGKKTDGLRIKWLGNQEDGNDIINPLNKINKLRKLEFIPEQYQDDYVFLALGFYSENELKAVIGLLRYQGKYSQLDIDALNPIVTTSATLIDAHYDKLKAAKTETLLRRLADIVAFSAESIISTDVNLNITNWNRAAEKLFGYQEEGVLGKSLEVILPSDRKKEAYYLRDEMLKGSTIKNYDMTLVNKEGQRIDALISVFPLKEQSGRIIGFSGIIRDNSEKRKMDQLRLKSIIEGEEKERNRIAHDLHDGLGQILTAMSLNLKAVKLNIDDDVNNLIQIAEMANSEYRAISQNLISPSIKGRGLEKSVKLICENLVRSGHDIRLLSSIDAPLNSEVEIIIYRCAQELINNAIKHSRASLIVVNLFADEEAITLSLADNGVGFQYDQKSYDRGLGLSSMRSRVQLLGGSFVISSHLSKGTSVTISFANNAKLKK